VVQSLNLTTTDFNLDFELPDKILLSGHDILEIPINYNPRTYAEGKKIKTSDGIRALFIMVPRQAGPDAGLQKELKTPTKTAANKRGSTSINSVMRDGMRVCLRITHQTHHFQRKQANMKIVITGSIAFDYLMLSRPFQRCLHRGSTAKSASAF
jgi:hypothetical protein